MLCMTFITESAAGLVLIFWLISNLYNLSMAAFFLLGRRQFRKSDRFVADIAYTLEQGTLHSEDHEDGSYTLAMTLDEQNGYLFGLYRQDLDWEGQDGTVISLYNDSKDSLLLMLQLIDADWQGIVLPDGTAVLLQEEGETGYTVVFASGGTIVVPAQFSGSLQGVDLHLQDSYLCIPQTGESMTIATTSGLGDGTDVVYTLVNPPLGATIDADGRIVIDSTVTVAELVARATVDQQLVLKTTLFLYTVWDSMPEDMELEDFTILDPSYYTNQGHYPLVEQLASHVYLLRMLGTGVGVVMLGCYVFWRKGRKKPQKGEITVIFIKKTDSDRVRHAVF